MKTLTFINKKGYCLRPVIVDFASCTLDTIEPIRVYIDDVYVAPEDIEVRYKKNGKEIVTKAKKGDIIISFYDDPTIINRIVVIKNDEWRENVANFLMEKAARQAKAETAASLCDKPCYAKDSCQF